MSNWLIWFVLAAVFVMLEMASGTFYLLMIAIGLAAGGRTGLAGAGLEWQYLVAAIVGAVANYALRNSRLGKHERVHAARDPNVNLDIG